MVVFLFLRYKETARKAIGRKVAFCRWTNLLQ